MSIHNPRHQSWALSGVSRSTHTHKHTILSLSHCLQTQRYTKSRRQDHSCQTSLVKHKNKYPGVTISAHNTTLQAPGRTLSGVSVHTALLQAPGQALSGVSAHNSLVLGFFFLRLCITLSILLHYHRWVGRLSRRNKRAEAEVVTVSKHNHNIVTMNGDSLRSTVD